MGMEERACLTPLGAVARRAAAGALGAVAMDLLWFPGTGTTAGTAGSSIGSSRLDSSTAGTELPPWEYDAEALWKDLSAHLVYGIATVTTFRGLAGR